MGTTQSLPCTGTCSLVSLLHSRVSYQNLLISLFSKPRRKPKHSMDNHEINIQNPCPQCPQGDQIEGYKTVRSDTAPRQPVEIPGCCVSLVHGQRSMWKEKEAGGTSRNKITYLFCLRKNNDMTHWSADEFHTAHLAIILHTDISSISSPPCHWAHRQTFDYCKFANIPLNGTEKKLIKM